MASTTQDKLYETFVAVSGQQNPSLDGALDSGEEIAASLSGTVKQLAELQGSSAAQATIGSGTPAADTTSSSAPATDASSGGSTPAAGTSSSGSPVGQQNSNLDEMLDSGPEIASSLSDAVNQIGQLSGNSAAQAASSSSNTSAASTSSGGSTAESIASTVLESGLGMVPLIVGLLGLFGGGGTPTPTLEKYAMPDRLYFEGADTGGDMSDADYDQMGMPRTYSAATDGTSPQTSGTASPGGSSGSAVPSGPSGAGAAQITVNVQAMDSQSFLDHSNEIAQAVRAAMLNSNSINDVVNNL